VGGRAIDRKKAAFAYEIRSQGEVGIRAKQPSEIRLRGNRLSLLLLEEETP
jgi:hypothetical protein